MEKPVPARRSHRRLCILASLDQGTRPLQGRVRWAEAPRVKVRVRWWFRYVFGWPILSSDRRGPCRGLLRGEGVGAGGRASGLGRPDWRPRPCSW